MNEDTAPTDPRPRFDTSPGPACRIAGVLATSWSPFPAIAGLETRAYGT